MTDASTVNGYNDDKSSEEYSESQDEYISSAEEEEEEESDCDSAVIEADYSQYTPNDIKRLEQTGAEQRKALKVLNGEYEAVLIERDRMEDEVEKSDEERRKEREQLNRLHDQLNVSKVKLRNLRKEGMLRLKRFYDLVVENTTPELQRTYAVALKNNASSKK